MSFYRQHWIRATRKPHRCGWCNKDIEAGSGAEYNSGIDPEGGFTAYYMHPECAHARDSLTRKQWEEMDHTFQFGEFPRGRADNHFDLPPIFNSNYHKL